MTKSLTGKHVLLWLGGTFGVVFAVNALFVTKALDTYPGEDVQNPYLQGVDYNQTLAQRADQASLGWNATIDGSRSKAGEAAISVVVDAKDGALPPGFVLSGELRHPADAERDRALTFSKVGDKTFVSHVKSVGAGAWDVIVSAHDTKNIPFEATRRLWLR
jgi:nitrogen fixation protein FixH